MSDSDSIADVSRPNQCLYLVTSAITREQTHIDSIGEFYRLFYAELAREVDSIRHIINIDHPQLLRSNPKFSIESTKKILRSNIPPDVDVTFIVSPTAIADSPTFGLAYMKLMVHLPTIKANDFVWWLEDDWAPISSGLPARLLFRLFTSFGKKSTAVAQSITNSAPLCSFRGGPIMSSEFFNLFFNLADPACSMETLCNSGPITFNPEEKVNRLIRFNRRVPVYSENIYLVCLHVLDQTTYPYTHNTFYSDYYNKKFTMTKFADGRGFRFINAFIHTADSTVVHHTNSECDTARDLAPVHSPDDVASLTSTPSIDEFVHLLTPCALVYISLFPTFLKDIGRSFNLANNVVSFAQK